LVLYFWQVRCGRRTGEGGFEELTDEFRLRVSSGFVENALGVGACRRLGDFELCCGDKEPVPANDFRNYAAFGRGEPEFCAKAPDLGAQIGCGIGDKTGGGRPVYIEDRNRAISGERKDMGA
jgi:hypothetical protein